MLTRQNTLFLENKKVKKLKPTIYKSQKETDVMWELHYVFFAFPPITFRLWANICRYIWGNTARGVTKVTKTTYTKNLWKLTWNIKEHYKNYEVTVTECKIATVWHFYCPKFRSRHLVLSRVQTQKFSSHSNGIQNNKRWISKKRNVLTK